MVRDRQHGFYAQALRAHLRCGASLACIIQSNPIQDTFALVASVSKKLPLAFEMSWWIAVPVFFTSWFFFVALGAGPKAIENERNGVPIDQRHGVSIAPGFPVFPAIAWLAWALSPVTAATAIFWVHIALLIFSVAMFIYYVLKLRRIKFERLSGADTDHSNAT